MGMLGGMTDPMGMLGGAMGMPGSNANWEGPPGGFIEGALGGGNTPQARGQGLVDPAAFEEYVSGPGLTWQMDDPYAASRGTNQGMDLTGPGGGENWASATAGRLMAPGAMPQYWGQVQNAMQQGAPKGSNYSEQEYLNFNRPNIAEGPGLDPYYARARQTAANELNNQFGSRGMFGSSAAMGQISDAFTGLGAEQANREADYALQRLGEQRAWEGLGGQLAGQADAMSRQENQDQLGWLTGLGGLAQAADQADLSRLGQGMSQAALGQQLREGRIGDYFNRVSALPAAMAPVAMGQYNQMIGDDMGLMDQTIMHALGLGAEARNQDYRTQEKIKADEQHAVDMFSGVMGGLMGGK